MMDHTTSVKATNLSESNCTDFIDSLRSDGVLQHLHKLSGKVYTTSEQIARKLSQELQTHEGRVLLTDLQLMLNLDGVLLHQAAENFAAENHEVDLVAGELVHGRYLDALAASLGRELRGGGGGGGGAASLGQLAQRYNLPVLYLQSKIEARLETHIKGKMQGGLVVTTAYEKRQIARAKGVLFAATRPISIPEIATLYGLEEPLVETTLRDLLASGGGGGDGGDDGDGDGDGNGGNGRAAPLLRGRLRGREWVPWVFEAAQRRAVDDFFGQNDYLEHRRLKDLQASVAFVKQSFPDAVDLIETVVSGAVVTAAEARAAETLQARGWVEGASFLPPALSFADVGLLLERAAAAARAAGGGGVGKDRTMEDLVVADQYLVSAGCLEDLLAGFRDPARVGGQAAAARQTRPALATSISSSADAQEADLIGVKISSTAKERQREDSSSKKGKKSKNTKGNKRGRQRKNNDSDNNEDIFQEENAELISLEEVEMLLVQQRGELGDHPELLAALTAELGPHVQALYAAEAARALAEAQRGPAGGASDRRRRQREAEDTLLGDTGLLRLRALRKGMAKLASLGLPAGGAAHRALEDHLLAARARPVAARLTRHAAHLRQVEFREQAYASNNGELVELLTDQEADKMESEMPEEAWEVIKRMWESLSGPHRSFSTFVELLEVEALQLCDVIPKKIDKKREKQLLSEHRQQLIEELSGCVDITTKSLRLIMALFFQQCHNVIIDLPDTEEANSSSSLFTIEEEDSFVQVISGSLSENRLAYLGKAMSILHQDDNRSKKEGNDGMVLQAATTNNVGTDDNRNSEPIREDLLTTLNGEKESENNRQSSAFVLTVLKELAISKKSDAGNEQL